MFCSDLVMFDSDFVCFESDDTFRSLCCIADLWILSCFVRIWSFFVT